MRTLFFDTEGNGYKDEELCQIAYIILEDSRHISKNFYFHVEHMNKYAFRVHHLSKLKLDELSSGKRFSDSYLEIFEDFSSVDLIVGHNVSSDIKRLQTEFLRNGNRFKPNATLCTMKFFSNALKLSSKDGKKKYPSLSELCSHYKVDQKDVQLACASFFNDSAIEAHDARYDTLATYLCVLAALRSGDIRGVI